MSKQQQRYLLRIVWREAMRAARGDQRRAAVYLPRIMTALGFRVRVTGKAVKA